jgi:hypothetical protein
MKSRSERLYAVGLEAWGVEEDCPLLRGIAAMIDEATKPATKRAPKETKPVVFAPANVFDALEEHCAHKIQLRPYDNRTFPALARTIASMPELEGTDLDKLCDWINGGGLDWYKGSATWNHAVKNFATWIQAARSWSANRGRPAQKDYIAFGGAKQL